MPAFLASGSELVVAGGYRIPHQSSSFVYCLVRARQAATMHCVCLPAPRYRPRGNWRGWRKALDVSGVDAGWLGTGPGAGTRLGGCSRCTNVSSTSDVHAWRLGEVLPHRDIAVLRGIEGARVKEVYRLTAERLDVRWAGRRYDCQ